MPFFKSLAADSGPGDVFTAYPEIYEPWSRMSQTLMNGPSPLSPGEREMIAAYVVGVAGCAYPYVAHTAMASCSAFSSQPASNTASASACVIAVGLSVSLRT